MQGFQKNIRRIFGLSVPAFSQVFKIIHSQSFEIYENRTFKKMDWFFSDFLDFVKYPGVSKDK